jgi:hypothetical protein
VGWVEAGGADHNWVEDFVRGRDGGAAGKGKWASAKEEGRGGGLDDRKKEMKEEKEQRPFMWEKRQNCANPDWVGLNRKGKRTGNETT